VTRFSIITVCLNEAETIRGTCESICSQSFQGFEWIVIDGCSTDGTLDVLSEYEHRIDHLISEADAGLYDAMNKGLRLAKGKYLLFLNAGDSLVGAQVLDVVSKVPDVDLIYGDLCCISEDNATFVKVFPDVLSKYYLLKQMMPHQASFIRRTLFDKYGDYDTSLKIAADYDLFVRFLYIHRISYIHVPQTLAVFVTDGLSSRADQRELRKNENHLVRKKYFPWFVYGLKGLKMQFRQPCKVNNVQTYNPNKSVRI